MIDEFPCLVCMRFRPKGIHCDRYKTEAIPVSLMTGKYMCEEFKPAGDHKFTRSGYAR